jgi:hypothetical protein
MASLAEDIVIRPICLQDAAALWAIARQEDEWLMARYR